MRHYHLIIILLVLVSFPYCSWDGSRYPRGISENAEWLSTSYVSQEEAESTVLSVLRDLNYLNTKGNNDILISDSWSTPSLVNKNVDGSPLFYIVNFEDDKGFAIAGADRRIPPLLCLVEQGSLHKGDTLDNPGIIAMLSRIEVESRMMMGLPIKDSNGNLLTSSNYRHILNPLRGSGDYNPDSCDVYYTFTQSYPPVGTQIGCKWDQHLPFNGMCPLIGDEHALVGCTPIAVGQIMYYHQKNATYNGYHYNWGQMHDIVCDTSSSFYPNAWHSVQRLLMDLGNENNLDATYGVKETCASDYHAPRTFENFYYQSGGTDQPYNYNTISSEISFGYPVLAVGYRDAKIIKSDGVPIDTLRSGHTWVIDQTMRTLWHIWVVHKRTNRLIYSTSIYRYYVHCNWGWGGSYNGFFLSQSFDLSDSLSVPETKSSYDTVNIINRVYKYDLRMVTGIRP